MSGAEHVIQPLLSLTGIEKAYPGVRALAGVDFSLEAGEVRALLGKNGAGKSTLVKVLSGAIQPDAGSLRLHGQPVRLGGPSDALAHGIATVYQETSLVPGLSAAENISLGRWPTRRGPGVRVVDRARTLDTARAALEELGVELPLDLPVGQLSTPQQQLVEIAKAVSFRPKVLILDEPTSALPSHEVEVLLGLVRRLAERGVAIIYVSHRLQEIPRIAHSVTVLRDGREVGSLLTTAQATPAVIANLMVGGVHESGTDAAPQPREQVVLAVRNLRLRGRLEDVSFELRQGEVLGLAGLLGSGRSEVLRAIFGLEALDGGSVLVDGVEIHDRTPARMKRLGLGLTPENRKREGLVMGMSVMHNLSLASLGRVSRSGVLNAAAEERLTGASMAELSVAGAGLRVAAGSLSGGNQQKIVIGKWLNAQVRVLLMDEPTQGVDIQAKEQVYGLIRALARQGVATVFVSSELEELFKVCGRILVLNGGRVSADLDVRETDHARVLALSMTDLSTRPELAGPLP